MNRRAQAVVLLLVGGAVLRVSLTDLYLRYVKEGLRPFLIAAGAALVVMAVMTLWYDLRAHPAEDHDVHGHNHGQDHGHDDGHGHGAGGPRVAWLLVLPVLVLVLVAPRALGSDAASRSGTALTENSVSDFPPLPAGDPVKISLLNYAARAVYDEGRSLESRRVELTGFITTGEDNQLFLTRMIVSCCAADGRPIKVGVTGNVPAGLTADTWISLVGTYTDRSLKDTINGETIPFVQAAEVREVDAPVEQYES